MAHYTKIGLLAKKNWFVSKKTDHIQIQNLISSEQLLSTCSAQHCSVFSSAPHFTARHCRQFQFLTVIISTQNVCC
jgi:hypothetical protein